MILTFRDLHPRACAIALVLALAACSEDPVEPENRIAEIEILPGEPVTVAQNESVRLEAVARTGTGDTLPDTDFFWMVRDSSIASIDATGTLMARALGQTYALAAAEGVMDSVHVIVTTVPIGEVIVLDSAILGAGSSLTLAAQAFDTAGREVPEIRFSWSSSDTAIATVDSLGMVTGLRMGTVGIRARAESQQGVTRVFVEPTYARIYVSFHHACVLDADGAAYCWGGNIRGELGTGVMHGGTTPRPVAGGHRFTSLALGELHTCGRTIESQVLCWGQNTFGQLGTGDSVEQRYVPTPVAHSATFADVISGEDHVCALDTGGQAYCWGRNFFGALGIGVRESIIVRAPRAVVGNTRFRQLASGAYRNTCGLSTSQEYFCWGRTYFAHDPGSLACDSLACVEPVRVLGAPRFKQIAGSYVVQCGLTQEETAHCWGWRWDFPNPKPYASELRFSVLSSGMNLHMCGVLADQKGYCWDVLADVPVPTQVGGDVPLEYLAGGWHGDFPGTCGISTDGVVYCWRDSLSEPPTVLPRPE